MSQIEFHYVICAFSIAMPSVMLSVAMISIVMLGVVIPKNRYAECRGATFNSLKSTLSNQFKFDVSNKRKFELKPNQLSTLFIKLDRFLSFTNILDYKMVMLAKLSK